MDKIAFKSLVDMIPGDEEIEERHVEQRADLKRRSALDLFNPLNLSHWIDLCVTADIPFVPAEEIARIETMDALAFDEDKAKLVCEEFESRVQAEMKKRGKDWMVRWSCCSCAEVKCRLGAGEYEWSSDLVKHFFIGDVRAYDLIYDFPEETIAAYARPWIKASVVDSYPVEYRVFVDHNRISGISNYYPQRPLPNNTDVLNDIFKCLVQTQRLLVRQTKSLNCPPLERYWDVTQNHWTADFIRNESGQILFLEGGPPHTPNGGAHMCCFLPNNVAGIALSDRAITAEPMEN